MKSHKALSKYKSSDIVQLLKVSQQMHNHMHAKVNAALGGPWKHSKKVPSFKTFLELLFSIAFRSKLEAT